MNERLPVGNSWMVAIVEVCGCERVLQFCARAAHERDSPAACFGCDAAVPYDCLLANCFVLFVGLCSRVCYKNLPVGAGELVRAVIV